MNKNKTLLALALTFVFLLGGAYLLYNRLAQNADPNQLVTQDEPQGEEGASESHTEEPEKIVAPDFTVYTLDGTEVHLSDFIGKPIVLNFWASWCGPCKLEMPGFHEKYLELGNEVSFLMVNVTTGRETLESASDFIKTNNYTFPVFYDTQSNAALTYGAYSLPTTYFIDAEGYAIAQATGSINSATLQQGIDLILPQQ